MEERLWQEIAELKQQLERLKRRETEFWVYPNDSAWPGTAGQPLTSTSWDGDAYSTTGKTLLDLSAVFSAPAGIRAAIFRIACRDSASSTTNNLYVSLSPSTGTHPPLLARPSGRNNDYYDEAYGIVACDANGDVYYQIAASGASTMDIFIQIWGYCF